MSIKIIYLSKWFSEIGIVNTEVFCQHWHKLEDVLGKYLMFSEHVFQVEAKFGNYFKEKEVGYLIESVNVGLVLNYEETAHRLFGLLLSFMGYSSVAPSSCLLFAYYFLWLLALILKIFRSHFLEVKLFAFQSRLSFGMGLVWELSYTFLQNFNEDDFIMDASFFFEEDLADSLNEIHGFFDEQKNQAFFVFFVDWAEQLSHERSPHDGKVFRIFLEDFWEMSDYLRLSMGVP